MHGKKRLPVPDNQLTLIPVEPAPPRKHRKPKGPKRIASLEERVTHLEAAATLVRGQLEREEDLYEEGD